MWSLTLDRLRRQRDLVQYRGPTPRTCSIKFEDIETASQETKLKYWFKPEKMSIYARCHDYLDNLPGNGKGAVGSDPRKA